MRDRDRREQLQDQLIDQLWPSAEPPPDMAARVLAAMHGQAVGSKDRRGRRVQWMAAALTATMAAGLTITWWARSTGQQEYEEQGGQVATARQTVNIGARAAAAMEPGADLRWSVRKTRATVNQRRGSVFYRVDRGGPFQVSTPDGDVEVTGTCFRVTHAVRGAMAGTTLVSVLEGSVNVRTAAGELSLKVGETARLTKGKPPQALMLPPAEGAAAHDEELRGGTLAAAAPLPTVEQEPAQQPRPREIARSVDRPSPLLLPPSTRLRIYGNPLRQVSLTVPPGRPGGAIEVARDRGFRRPIFSGPARAPFVTVAAPARGDLYWRLAGQSEVAGHARFLPDQLGSAPWRDSPHNVVSEGRQSTTIYFQGAPPALTLTFAPTLSARRYQVRVFRAGHPDRPVLERVVTEPRCALGAGTLVEGHYLWSALPVDQGGRPLGSGPVNKLELAYDNARSTLAITQPRPIRGMWGRAVHVAGVAPLGARLFVNGTPAPVDDKGRFGLKVGGAPRVLVFRLLGSDGAESYWIRNLKSGS